MRTHISILLLILGFCLPVQANWQRNITNYSRSTYQSGNQNWMIMQHTNGWMYFANNKGLLEFDGVTWNTYSMNESKTRALCIGADSCIYIGGMGQFGYFNANKLGGLDYHCLSDSLPQDMKIDVIWNIHAAGNRIYFQSDWDMYYKEGNSIKKIHAPSAIKRSALINGKLYIADERGLSIINGNNFQTLPNTQAIVPYKIAELLPFEDKVLIVTRHNGLFLYDGHSLQPYSTAADNFISHNHLFCAAIKGNTLVLGSIQDGALLVYLKEDRIEKISTNNGLQNKTILSAAFDTDNNLWLGLDNGIDYIQLNSPIFPLYGNKPVIGSGYTSCVYNGKLYLGTNQGLYRSDLTTTPDVDICIERIEEVGGQVWGLNVHDGKLFCSSDAGIFILSVNGTEHLQGIRGVWSIISLNHPDLLIAGTYSGLYLLKKENGKWKLSHHLEGYTFSCKNLFVESSNIIWVSNKGDGVYRLTLSDDLSQIIKTKNYNNDSIPKRKGLSFSTINNEIIMATCHGLFKYNHIKDELEPFEALENKLMGKTHYQLLRQSTDGAIWYAVNGTLYLACQDMINEKECHQNNSFLHNSLIDGFEHINLLDSKHLIVGTEEGFSLLVEPHKAMLSYPLNLQIRKVFFTGRRDSLMYGCSYLHDDAPLIIPYSQNCIRIVCSANNFSSPDNNLYSYRLKGEKGSEWSEYSESNSKEYTDLREGNYTFQVRLMSHAGTEPAIASFTFRVLPPWYRSWWMYLAYIALAGSLLFYLYKRIDTKQKAIILKQQQEIEQKEEAFKKESQLKDQKIVSLEEENLQAELNHKTEELVRTTLNIVRKNEILQEIKKEALSISKAIKDENLVNIRRSTLRLISNIDNNLEHDDDILIFENAFDSVHRDFFKCLDQRFPSLNKKEKMMCAYIKMNLMSKEIAPLLNISLRGVEIARYRLRKKLDLEEGINLADFLQKLSDK
ncbi:ligand-binding sensor domain-containing protein [Phocaeicola sp.]